MAERKRDKLIALYNAANTFGDVANQYIDKMVSEGRAETTTTKAAWLLKQLVPIARNALADLKPVEVLAASSSRCCRRSAASSRPRFPKY